MLSTEYVSVIADGRPFDSFEKISVGYAIDHATRDFRIDTTERPGEFNFIPGTPIKIYATPDPLRFGFATSNQPADLLIDGYVNEYGASGAAKKHSVNIVGRSKSQDVVDSSAVHDTGHFENQTPEQALKSLDQFGVGIKADVPLKPVPYMQIKPGESVFQFGERYLRSQGASLMGEADGSISITNASVAKQHAGMLAEGDNIEEWQYRFTDGERHSRYLVKGQGRLGLHKSNLRSTGRAEDTGVKRNRPKVIAHESDSDDSSAAERAHHEKERAAGNSISCTVNVPGWRDADGQIWQANRLVYVHSPILMHLSALMLIKQVGLEQSSGKQGGTKAILQLVDPRAFRGKAGASSRGKKQTSNAWTDGY